MEIFARLSVTGLRGNEAPDTKTIYNIKVGNTRIPSLWPENNTVIRLYPEDSESFADAAFPEHLREKISLRTLTLEDLLELGRQSQLRIVIFGHDSFSGSRKIFESKLYDKTSINAGMFFSDSLDVDVGNLTSIRSSDGLTRA